MAGDVLRQDSFMGDITYLVGSRVDGRQALLAEKMKSPGVRSILHLVPTRGRVMELETEQHFWPRRKANTLTRVIYRIFEEDIRYRRFPGHTYIDASLQSLLMKKVLDNRGSQPDGLVYFNRLLSRDNQGREFPGVYQSIARFFSLLVRNQYEDRFAGDLAGRMIRLEESGQGSGEERYGLESDLTWLFGDYEEIKREIRGYDEDDILSGVRRFLIEGGRPSLMTKTDVLVFDGYMHLSRIEEDILFHLFGLAERVWWLLDYDGEAGDPLAGFRDSSGREGKEPGAKEAYRVFAPMVSLMDRLEDAGFRSGIERVRDPGVFGSAAGLYMGGGERAEGETRLRVRSFGGREEEVRAIAAEIKRIIHEENLDPVTDLGKFRVIFPDLGDYSSVLSEVFGRYAIPFSLTRGLPLTFHPMSGLFQDIFRTVLNRFKVEDLFRLFSSGLIREGCQSADEIGPFPVNGEFLLSGDEEIKETGEGPFRRTDISLFKKAALECGIRDLNFDLSGLSGKGLLAVRDLYNERIKRVRDASERNSLRLEYYGFIAQCGILESKLRPFLGLARQKSPEGILAGFNRVLDLLGFPENILDSTEKAGFLAPDEKREMIKRDFKAHSLLRDLLRESARELQVAAGLFHKRSGHDLLSEYYKVFNLRLNDAYLLDERNPNIVRVSQWLEIRGRAFDYVFAGGMTSEKFPFREELNFILPESSGRIFRRPDPVDQSKYLFSHLLRNYRKALYLSYPRQAEGKDLQPSQVLADLESMVQEGAPAGDGGALEEVYRWEDSPYLSSEDEMLNALIEKDVRVDKPAEKEEEPVLPLHQVILKKESNLEGLIRGVRTIVSRWSLDGLFEYDGMTEGSARFKSYVETRKDLFSASQLELLANCPMRYLFERLFGLKRVEELGAEASPRDMGTHIHTILHLLFKELRDRGTNIADLGLKRAFPLAMEAARKVFETLPSLKRLEFFESQKRELLAGLEGSGNERGEEPGEREGLLALLLRFEEKAFRDRIPEGVEYEFGFKDGPPVPLGETQLRGYIDRFDRDREDGGRLHVYDYKSGAVPLLNRMKMGLSFQLPVYIRALREAYRGERISAAFYSLKRNTILANGPVGRIIGDRVEDAVSLDISGVRLFDEYANALKEILEKGRFHHSADGEICHYCEFRYACHRDERRMEHLLETEGGRPVYSGRKNIEKWKRVDLFRKDLKDARKSMQKSLTLKTAPARKKHAESVLDFRDWIKKNRGSLPFHDDYIDELLDELAGFEEKVTGS